MGDSGSNPCSVLIWDGFDLDVMTVLAVGKESAQAQSLRCLRVKLQGTAGTEREALLPRACFY